MSTAVRTGITQSASPSPPSPPFPAACSLPAGRDAGLQTLLSQVNEAPWRDTGRIWPGTRLMSCTEHMGAYDSERSLVHTSRSCVPLSICFLSGSLLPHGRRGLPITTEAVFLVPFHALLQHSFILPERGGT